MDVEECSAGRRSLKREAVDNGSRFGIVNSDLAGCGSGRTASLRTYKRRKHAKSGSDSKSEDDGTFSAKDSGQMSHQFLKESKSGINPDAFKQADLPTNYIAGCSKMIWKFASEDMLFSSSASSTGEEVGMQKGVCEEHDFVPKTGGILKAKEHVCPDENRQACNSQAKILLRKFSEENSHALPNGNAESLCQHPVAEKVRHVWRDAIVSEKFTSLCKLLSDNFPGINIDSFLGLNLINSKMVDGAYECSPTLFLSDFQQVWEKVKKIGSDMESVAENISNIFSSSYKREFPSGESNSWPKKEQGENDNSYKVCRGEGCGDKADGRDCLICDSCEDMYHVSCIVPAVKEIPLNSWYCSSCGSPENQSPHDNCTVCQRMEKAPKSTLNKPCTEETHKDLGESVNFVAEEGFREAKSGNILGVCKNCESDIHESEKSKTCSHRFCPSQHYHMRCLVKNELKSYGPGWYCPSCLCRSCLTDRDDDKIVLCDGCDHAYHIYCTKPMLDSIPSGKWFCGSCDAKLVEIQRAKKAHSRYEVIQRKKGGEGEGSFGFMEKQWNRNGCVEQDKGGMEMLLTAVTTLTCDET